MIIEIPTIPARTVFWSDESPKDAATVFEEISVSFVGKLPELIKSTNVEESSSSFNIIPFIIAGIVTTVLVVIGIILKKKKNA